jgi:chemotaxis protein methyltransferase CheR
LSLGEEISQQQIDQIEKIMLQRLGKDLGQFKKPFINRRINARMRSVGITDSSEYAKLLESDSGEPTLLFKSLSINVTEFNRDSFVWQYLASTIIPEIGKNNPSLKIWSAGCASGEEAYSFAILTKETINSKISIIATDINAEALLRAKKGQYPSANLKNLSPELIAKYFTKINDDLYQINDEIKQLVQFEHGDILSFQINSVNLISCRNVLIYYAKPAQELIFKKFHNILTKDGYIVIGQDETMMGVEAAKLFSCTLPRERIYKVVPK